MNINSTTKNPNEAYIPTVKSIAAHFDRARITTITASCPVCGGPLKIFDNEWSIGFKCPSRCPRHLVLAKVGLVPADLYPRWSNNGAKAKLDPLTPDLVVRAESPAETPNSVGVANG